MVVRQRGSDVRHATNFDGNAVSARVTTEGEFGQRHSVFFNRGAVASQEYAPRFLNQSPSAVGAPAFKWLSRGLLDAFVSFISGANGSEFGLHGARTAKVPGDRKGSRNR